MKKTSLSENKNSMRAFWFAGVCSFSLLCLSPVALAVSEQAPSTQHWSNYLSQALDGADLDARDAHNRPIRSRKDQSRLKELFVASAYRMILDRDLPLISQVRKTLEMMVNPWRERWARTQRQLAQVLEIIFCFSFKRWTDSLSPWRSLMLFVTAAFFVQTFLSRLLFGAAPLPVRLPLRC